MDLRVALLILALATALALSAIVGAAAGLLAWIGGSSPAKSTLQGGAALGATFALAVGLLGLLLTAFH
ncbi:hypothetical protein [Dactylosporangium matsuzakiense]|uniref:Uncharacterized protein n=1 Tax=Dactylosporangium matsuzakiense TaxID=53360 RepID=A0A9W6KRL9_9ACTN|nr:hypothetical protein [Dactylosporangium matsuzakiense]GLL05135.1 hypothetical protein GCM10017581_068820 [Dactylosporangium matsuzakiense]